MAEVDIQTPLEALEPITSPQQFETLVTQQPSLFGQAVLDSLQQLEHDPNVVSFVSPLSDLVKGAQRRPAEAWLTFRTAMDEIEVQGREFEPVLEHLTDLMGSESYDDVIALGEEALPRALELGLGVVVGEIHALLADAFRQRATGDPGDNIDIAIDHTVGALAAALDPAHRVSLQMNLAVLVASRKKGDPAENSEDGVAILRGALDQLDDTSPGDLRATVQTNLARALQVRERGDHLANLREARDLAIAALEWRSLDRNGEDWAYTKINLGAITADLSILGEADPAHAESHLLDVISAAPEVGDASLIGAVHASLGGLRRRAAERIAVQEGRVVIGPGKPPLPGHAESELLRTAREHLSAALALLDPEADRDLVGGTLDDLGAVHEALGDDGSAIEVYRRALSALRPTSTPSECQHAGGRLGELLARRGDWHGSAAAYSMAIQAGEFAFHARLETADRAAEAERSGNLGRWAAFALAKTGDTDLAVLALENSRTREFRRRLGLAADEAFVEQLPSEARIDYLQALAELSVASLSAQSDDAGRRLQQVLSRIRDLPGFEGFAKGVDWSDVAAAVEPESPLVYVDPTPFGTLILSVADTAGGITRTARFLDTPSSYDVFMALIFGDTSSPTAPSSYLAGTSGANDDPEAFRRGLDHVLATLGDWIARPLAEDLENLGTTGVTIVACGPISQAPLHAATWSGERGTVSLLDLFDVRFTPSATLHLACLRRARELADKDLRLTAVGNPDLGDPKHDLPAAEPEVREIARHFPSHNAAIATREQATSSFLAANAPTATHLHLACHGKGGLLDPQDAGLALADGWVPAAELAGQKLAARLTVLSACETAVAEIARLPDEAFSLSTAFLAAGSAGAVATLWSIDDAATALLMTRFYEELFNGSQPTQALRRTQLWIRELTETEEDAFLDEHPWLSDEFKRRVDQGRKPGLRSPSDSDAAWLGRRPYSAPEFWAAFVAVGA